LAAYIDVEPTALALEDHPPGAFSIDLQRVISAFFV
jgi:hypothetical protein